MFCFCGLFLCFFVSFCCCSFFRRKNPLEWNRIYWFTFLTLAAGRRRQLRLQLGKGKEKSFFFCDFHDVFTIYFRRSFFLMFFCSFLLLFLFSLKNIPLIELISWTRIVESHLYPLPPEGDDRYCTSTAWERQASSVLPESRGLFVHFCVFFFHCVFRDAFFSWLKKPHHTS